MSNTASRAQDIVLLQDKEASLLGEDGTEEGDSDADSDDEAGFVEDDKAPFEAGAGVEEIMQMLEEGGTLPDIEGLATAEDPQVCYSCCTIIEW